MMSLLWRNAVVHTASDDRPWNEMNDGDLHEAGVEEIGGMNVAHPDDTPWHDDDLMETAHVTHGRMNPHGDHFEAMQAWLDKDRLNHFHEHPGELEHEPVHMIHDEDTGEHFLLDGHHRVTIARHHGAPATLPARISHVSRSRM
jgi:hypothetical protein